MEDSYDDKMHRCKEEDGGRPDLRSSQMDSLGTSSYIAQSLYI